VHWGLELAEMVAGPFCNGGPVNVMMELLLVTENKKLGALGFQSRQMQST